MFLVAASRADERGTEEAIGRFLEWNADRFPGVVVLVEWGDPVEGRKPLHEVFLPEVYNVVFVTVPDEAAQEYRPDGMWAEHAAKNLGVRVVETMAQPIQWNCRPFFFYDDPLIICTNADCFVSEELAFALKHHRPKAHRMYRSQRWDFVEYPPGAGPFTTRSCGKRYGAAAGDFTGFVLSEWKKLGGYKESREFRLHLDSELTNRAVDAGYGVTILPPIYHHDHPEAMCNTNWHPSWGPMCAPTNQEHWVPVDERGLREFGLKRVSPRLFTVEAGDA